MSNANLRLHQASSTFIFRPSLRQQTYLILTLLLIIPLVWFAYIEGQQVNEQLLTVKKQTLLTIVTRLEQQLPASYNKILQDSGLANASDDEKRLALNGVCQPVIEKVSREFPDSYSLGYYHKDLNIIAYLPKTDESMLGRIAHPESLRVYESHRTEYSYIDQGFTQGNAPILAVNYPLFRDGIIIGHVYATIKTNDIEQEYWHSWQKNVLSFGLVWAGVLGTVAFSFRRLNSLITKVNTNLKNNDNSREPFESYPELASTVAQVEELRAQLMQREQDYINLAKNSPYGIIRCDLNLCYLYVNCTYERWFGISGDKLIGRTWADMGVPEEVYQQWLVHYQQALRTRQEQEFEALCPNARGIMRTYRFSVITELGESGSPESFLVTLRDITEQKQAEELFHKAFHLNPSMMFITSRQNETYIDANEPYAQTVGLRREQIIGCSAGEINLWHDEEERQRVHSQLCREGKLYNVEIKYRRNSEEPGIALLTAENIRLGANDCVLNIITDITELKKSEEILISSEKWLRDILDQCPIGIVVTDKNGIVKFMNEVLITASLGKAWEDCIGRSYFDVLTHMTHPLEESPIYRALMGAKTTDTRLRRAGREWTVNATPMYQGNEITGAIGLYQDITEMIKKDRDRREALERFEKVFHHSLTAKSIVRLADRKIIDVNPAWEQLFGYTREEVIGLSAYDLEIACQQSPDIITFRTNLTEEGSTQQEVSVRRRDGQTRRLICSAKAININGEPHFMNSIHDITELRRIEAEIAHFDRLNLIGQMAAGIGHEVRNPMTTVRGYLQLLQIKKEFAKYHEQFCIMIDEIDRANGIITEFLSLAKDKAVEMKCGNLNTVIMSLLPLLQADAFHRGHQLHINIDQIPNNEFDEKEIRQLILNLVRNSFEAMEEGGKVVIRTYQQDNGIVLEIQDTGSGIPDEIMKKLGTPFITTKDNGTGLGLPVCYRIAERHGANIKVDTGFQGTTFTIVFNFRR